MSDGERRYYGLDALRGVMMMLGIVLHAANFYLAAPPPIFPIPSDRNNSLFFDLLFHFIHQFRMPTFFVLAGFFSALLVEKRGLWGTYKDCPAKVGRTADGIWHIFNSATGKIVNAAKVQTWSMGVTTVHGICTPDATIVGFGARIGLVKVCYLIVDADFLTPRQLRMLQQVFGFHSLEDEIDFIGRIRGRVELRVLMKIRDPDRLNALGV